MLFLSLSLLLLPLVRAAQNQLVQLSGISPNPNNVGFYLYKPNKLASPLPLIVAIHYCTGTAQAYFSGTQYANLADTYGYLVIYPNAPRSGTCFDVSTPQTLTHNGGGDSQGIASAVTYAINNLGVSASHVYVTGSSSGAMMTNVMAGAYPNLFAAASVYSGVPFHCFYVNSNTYTWNSQCANGDISMTAQQWGDLVRAAYPGYTGSRPRMMEWHGTVDTTLYYENYGQELLQWSNVFNLSSTATVTNQNNPQSGYTESIFGNPVEVVGYSGAGVGHTVPVHETVDLAWFQIAGSFSWGTPPNGGSTTVGTSTPGGGQTTTKTTTTTTSGACSAEWGQCGGIGWTGPQCCQSPYTCKASNAYYSQCL